MFGENLWNVRFECQGQKHIDVGTRQAFGCALVFNRGNRTLNLGVSAGITLSSG